MQGWPRRRAAGVAALALTATALAGCSDRPDYFPEGGVDDDLAQQLEDVGITYYLPDLRGSEATETRYDDDYGGAVVEFEGIEDAVTSDSWQLQEYRAPSTVLRSVCSARNSDNTDENCDEEEGWAWDDYEGSTSVYVLRGDTLLQANLETEDDSALIDQAVEALMEAREISPEDLARN